VSGDVVGVLIIVALSVLTAVVITLLWEEWNR
jgi:hypothetical protein